MLATPSTGSSGRQPIDLDTIMATGQFMLDTKLDGVRAFLRDGRILNRKGADITHKFPEITNPTDRWLDGEIVALDNSFETTLMRESQEIAPKIRRAAEEHPCRFVAFDLPDLANEPWETRRWVLVHLHSDLSVTPVSSEVAFFDKVGALGMEGVIAKRRTSRYAFGKRSSSWIKFKHLHRVSCLIAGYTPGHGAREHFGALTLALVDPAGGVVSVGRCGSGFTVRQMEVLKGRLDNGEILIAEIETVNVTSGRTLRFPVYRGLRTDLNPLDCTTDQLAALPRC